MDMFDAAIQIAKAFHERQLKIAEAKRVLRNERRRKRYAIAKGLPKKPKPEPFVEPEYEAPDCCFCATIRMPPCSWCTSPERTEEDFQ